MAVNTAPDPAMVAQMVKAALRSYGNAYRLRFLVKAVARVCDELRIDRAQFCKLVQEEPKKTRENKKDE
jgi:hypothetical protein